MIKDKKLLCAFIYAAYKSGYCGLSLNKKVRKEHINRFLGYLTDKQTFPKREINKTANKLGDILNSNSNSIRKYIYKGHLGLVKKKIKKESGQGFEKAIKDSFFSNIAALCVVRLYEVLSVKKGYISVRDDFLNKTKQLKIISNNEKPHIGDIVSGHWSHMLEIVDKGQLVKYKPILKQYLSSIKRKKN